MKKNIESLLFLLMLLSTYYLVSCKSLYFQNPVPKAGKVIKVLPSYLQGVFEVDSSLHDYIEIIQVDSSLCYIQQFKAIPREELMKVLAIQMQADSSNIELKGNTIFFNIEDSIVQKSFWIQNDTFYTEKELKYEINLREGYFLKEFKSKKRPRALLKELDETYYLNVVTDDNWFLISWKHDINKNALNIKYSELKDTLFSDTNTYYNGITPISKISSDDYVCNPTDEAFFILMNEHKLFTQQTWRKLTFSKPNHSKQYVLYIFLFIAFLVLIISFLKTQCSSI